MNYKKTNKHINNVSTPSGFATPSLRERAGVRWLSLLLGVGALLLSCGSLSAQVTIGSGTAPVAGALLDLKDDGSYGATGATAMKGLGMPRVKLESLTKLKMGDNEISDGSTGEYAKHIGLLVYNTEEVKVGDELLCKGLQVWTGTKWQPLSPMTAGRIDSETPMSETTRTINAAWTGSAGDSPRPLGQFKDIRGTGAGEEINFYEHALMYYEDVKKETWTKYTGVKASCDPNASGAVENWETAKVTTTNTKPVIMMTENLNTRYAPTGELLGVHTNANEVANAVTFYPGDKGNGATTDKLLNVNLPKTWTDGQGMLYNWASATVGADGVHGKGGGDGLQNNIDEVGANEGAQVQGVCPTGWHLPSDIELTQLEEAMKLKVASFSNGGNNSAMGDVWKSPLQLPLSTYPADGKSLSSYHGGFNLLLAGFAYGGSALNYGDNAYLWSSSSYVGSGAWSRGVGSGNALVSRGIYGRYYLFSVRCKKD